MVSVADAIRSKTGGSDPLSFPTGFSEAIEGISGGGSGVDISEFKPFIYFWASNSYSTEILSEPLSITDSMLTRYKEMLGVPDITISMEYSGSASDNSIAGPLAKIVPYSNIELTDRGFIILNEGLFANTNTYGYIRDWSATTIKAKQLVEGTVTLGNSESVVLTSLPYGFFARSYLTSFPTFLTPQISLGKYCFIHGKFHNPNIDLTGFTYISLNTYSLYDVESITYTIAEDGSVTTAYGPITLRIGKIPYNAGGSYTSAIGGTSENKMIVEFIESTPQTLSDTSMFVKSLIEKMIVPKGSLEAYQTATNWSAYADIMVEAEE